MVTNSTSYQVGTKREKYKNRFNAGKGNNKWLYFFFTETISPPKNIRKRYELMT